MCGVSRTRPAAARATGWFSCLPGQREGRARLGFTAALGPGTTRLTSSLWAVDCRGRLKFSSHEMAEGRAGAGYAWLSHALPRDLRPDCWLVAAVQLGQGKPVQQDFC